MENKENWLTKQKSVSELVKIFDRSSKSSAEESQLTEQQIDLLIKATEKLKELDELLASKRSQLSNKASLYGESLAIKNNLETILNQKLKKLQKKQESLESVKKLSNIN